MKSANNFYNEQVTKSGRGRFPGQTKYNDPVPTGGGYLYSGTEDQSDAEDKVKEDLQGLDSNGDGDYDDTGEYCSFLYAYNNSTEAALWASVFGTQNDDAPAPSGSNISDEEDPSSDYYSNNEVTPGLGAEEFLEAFGGDAIKSPFPGWSLYIHCNCR